MKRLKSFDDLTRVKKIGDLSPGRKLALSFGNTENKSYLCNGNINETMIETLANIETYTLQVPQADARFLAALVKKMGWTKKRVHIEKRVKKNGLEQALEDIEKGDLKTFDNVDSLMDYLHS